MMLPILEQIADGGASLTTALTSKLNLVTISLTKNKKLFERLTTKAERHGCLTVSMIGVKKILLYTLLPLIK